MRFELFVIPDRTFSQLRFIAKICLQIHK
jgi:hypothetical protein